jgi:hypothetical protein
MPAEREVSAIKKIAYFRFSPDGTFVRLLNREPHKKGEAACFAFHFL